MGAGLNDGAYKTDGRTWRTDDALAYPTDYASRDENVFGHGDLRLRVDRGRQGRRKERVYRVQKIHRGHVEWPSFWFSRG